MSAASVGSWPASLTRLCAAAQRQDGRRLLAILIPLIANPAGMNIQTGGKILRVPPDENQPGRFGR